MRFLLLVTLSVLFGYGTCYANCFKEKSLACHQKLQNNVAQEKDFSFCGFQRKVIHCLINSATECNMTFKSLAQNFNSVAEKVCKKSDLHKELQKNRECIIKGLINTKCLEPFINIMKNGNTPRNVLKSQKEACRQLDKTAECTKKSVKDSCKKDVEAFISLYDSAIEMHRGICEEIILPQSEEEFTTQRSEKTILPPFFGTLEFII